MKISAIITIAICLVTVSVGGEAQAQTKLATVDMSRILTEAESAKASRDEIDKKMSTAKTRIEEKQKELVAFQEKMKTPKELDQYEKDRKELERYIQDSREEIGRQIDQVTKGLTTKALSLIQAYAKSNNIELVIDKSGKFRSPVLFSVPSADITEKILEQLDS